MTEVEAKGLKPGDTVRLTMPLHQRNHDPVPVGRDLEVDEPPLEVDLPNRRYLVRLVHGGGLLAVPIQCFESPARRPEVCRCDIRFGCTCEVGRRELDEERGVPR